MEGGHEIEKCLKKYSVSTGAALGRVHTGSVNPWISRIFAKHPMKFDIKSDPSIIVNPWIEIPNVVTEVCTQVDEWKFDKFEKKYFISIFYPGWILWYPNSFKHSLETFFMQKWAL